MRDGISDKYLLSLFPSSVGTIEGIGLQNAVPAYTEIITFDYSRTETEPLLTMTNRNSCMTSHFSNVYWNSSDLQTSNIIHISALLLKILENWSISWTTQVSIWSPYLYFIFTNARSDQKWNISATSGPELPSPCLPVLWESDELISALDPVSHRRNVTCLSLLYFHAIYPRVNYHNSVRIPILSI